MRRFLLLLTLALIGLVVVYRDRLYLRDPLGKVERKGVPQTEAQVYINYENDVLVREQHGAAMFVVQHWNGLPATPGALTCIEGMLCLTPADRVVDIDAAGPGMAAQAAATMTDREVVFVTNGGGGPVRVTIR